MIPWGRWVIVFDTGVFELSDWAGFDQIATIGWVI
jgi:hypothetical protein